MNKDLRILSGSALKMIALATMIIDHIGSVLLPYFPAAVSPLFMVASQKITWYFIFRLIGRTAFPLYCFLITEGFQHTHDRKKYGTRLLVFALISEIPWNLEHSGRLIYSGQNVFFTLFLGYVCLCVYEQYKDDIRKLFPALSLIFTASVLIRSDYGVKGVMFILFFYIMRESKLVRSFIGTAFFNRPWAVIPAFVLIGAYSGKRGFIRSKPLQIAFYTVYPLHILILYTVKLHFFGYA